MQTDNIEHLYENMPGDIIATFSTKQHSRFRVDSTLQSLETQMDENALDLLIKSLLYDQVQEQQLSSIRFQFVINDQLLRGKIKSHLVRYNIMSEQTHNIQYFIAIQTPEQKHQNKEDDWISVITGMPRLDAKSYYAVAMYNGDVSIYDYNDKLVFKENIGEDPIKCIKIIPSSVQNQYYLLSGGLNEIGKVHTLSHIKAGFTLEQKATFTPEKSTEIYAIDTSPLFDNVFCSAGGNQHINIWKIPDTFDDNTKATKGSKKSKTNNTNNVLSLTASSQIHDHEILSLLWFSDTEIYTGSADHTIKIIDVERLEESSVIYTKDSITSSIDAKYDNILSAHEDGYIRLWDKRSTHQVKSFKSHNKYASAVKFSQSPNIFASSSYDHTVKIWDIRSIFPIQTLTSHHDKVFSIHWKDHNELVSGGSDSKICSYSSFLPK